MSEEIRKQALSKTLMIRALKDLQNAIDQFTEVDDIDVQTTATLNEILYEIAQEHCPDLLVEEV